MVRKEMVDEGAVLGVAVDEGFVEGGLENVAEVLLVVDPRGASHVLGTEQLVADAVDEVAALNREN